MDPQASPLIHWPSPDKFDIIIVLCLVLLAIAIYCIYKYYKAKERIRMKNNHLFLSQIRRKGLNDSQLKLIKKMRSYLQLNNPMAIITDANLFESSLTGFIQYLAKEADADPEVDFEEIFRDLIIIFDKLYSSKQLKIKITLESMSGIEIGQILYIKTEYDDIILGKNFSKSEDHLGLQLFIPTSELRYFEDEAKLSIHIIKPDDAEYLIHTVTMGIESNLLLVKMSDNFSKVREFTHPYIDVMIPAFITIYSLDGKENPVDIECTIFKINEDECVLRIDRALEYEREYPITFELDKYKYNVSSRIISLKAIEKDSVYYSTFRFMDMTEQGKKRLIKYISESDNFKI